MADIGIFTNKLKPRGVRLSDDHWDYLNVVASVENKKFDREITASDIIRHAIDKMMNK